MSICGSNLIPIFISLLCCGAIFIYFNLRLNEVKFAVEKQNRVLTAFITNVQQDIRAGGGGCMLPIPSVHNNFAAPEAIIAAQKFMNESDKIVVSDDEEDDDDDEDDSDSDSSDSDEDEDEEAPTIKNIKIVNLQERPMIPIAFEFEELTCVLGETSTANNPESSSIMEIMDVSLSLANVNVSEANVSVSEANTNTNTNTNTNVSVSEANANTNTTTDAPTTYEQMKIDELRKVATDKNLAPKEEIKRMKKPELLVLLKK